MAQLNGSCQLDADPHSYLEPLPPPQSKPENKLDAGLRSLDHYRSRLPSWRYVSRQTLIPFVRWETPYLARIQRSVRSPALDTYFSIMANLGTHTFYMIFLPILFWCGHTALGRAMVNVLATGVFFSGCLKDLWCMPRPLSPPLHRITMSSSATLEYGFPSTHSTNAVSVALYILVLLSSSETPILPVWRTYLQLIACFYALSIVLGRLYCGMHGFFDVVVGSSLGAILSVLQFGFGQEFDNMIYSSSIQAPLTLALIILILVRIHPEPADDCPCFDDSVAFAGVVIGIYLGSWRFAQRDVAWDSQGLATVPFHFESLGLSKTIARVMLGTAMIVFWKEAMKPILLKLLPYLLRVIEKMGLSHARRFFIPASEYNRVPGHLKDDNVIPSVAELPSIINSLRHPRKSRSISIGPQSAADAYETLAYRDSRRRESRSGSTKERPDYFSQGLSNGVATKNGTGQIKISSTFSYHADNSLSPETALYTPVDNQEGTSSISASRQPSQERRQDEKEEREMFSKLEKPRVRYDVEVISKLFVYAGIGWIAVEGAPTLFELVGLGVGDLAST